MTLDYRLTRIVETFINDNIIFALAGGFAFSIHIIPRATTDIDFVIFAPDSIHRVESSLKKLYQAVIPHPKPIKAGIFNVWRFIGIDDEENVIDILITDNTEFSENASKRINYIEYNSTKIPLLSIEDIYIMKKNSKRLQDINDCDMIEKVKGETLDWIYIKRYTGNTV